MHGWRTFSGLRLVPQSPTLPLSWQSGAQDCTAGSCLPLILPTELVLPLACFLHGAL